MLQASVVSVRVPVFASVGAVRARRMAERVVSLDVTVPGLNSAGPRRRVLATLGDDVRVYVVSTDHRERSMTLRVEVKGRDVGDVIGALAGCFQEATLGRTVTTLVRHAG